MSSLEQLNTQVVRANERRRHFERTPLQLAEQIVEEAQELVEEIKEAEITGNAYLVAGEIGDLYSLLAQVCVDTGIDPVQAMKMKLARNQYKYPDYTLNNGYEPGEAKRMSKDIFEQVMGESGFSHIYLDVLAED